MMEKLSRRLKLTYGSGDISFSLTSTIIGAYFAVYLTDVVRASPAVAAFAIFVGGTWDYINDPIVGYISDRTRSRWGRRRPFLLFGALPLALAFALMWWRPPLASALALGIYYALIYALYDTVATFAYMPYFALTPELTSDYDERTALTTTRMFFSILGSLVAFTVPLLIVEKFDPAHAGRVLLMGGAFGLISAIPLLLVFFGTREREDFMRQKPAGLRQSVRAAWKNRPFVFGLVIFLFTWTTISIIQLVMIFYIKRVIQREAESDLIMAAIFVTAMFALPLWEWLSRKWNKRWAYIAGVAFLTLVLLTLASLGPATGMDVVLILCVLAGIGVAAAHVLPWSILPDAIEYGEYQTGERHEGMFYSLITLAQKIAVSVALPLALLILNSSGYNAELAVQPASAINAIRLIAGPIPGVFLGVGILFAALYPLGRENYSRMARELEARRKSVSPGSEGRAP
jgi:GPH family glycoside/pentoside/hexuronide:cation symporter